VTPGERFEREEADGAAETSRFIELLDAEARDRLRDVEESQ